jgi:DNA-binding response OmpR family regulator
MTGRLDGLRIMVVEDELLVAMLIEDALALEGADVLGPFSTLAEALPAAETLGIDAAVLDVNLRGERVYPAAQALAARGIPFLLLSGYGADAVPPDQPGWRACFKPFTPGQLLTALTEQILAGTPH